MKKQLLVLVLLMCIGWNAKAVASAEMRYEYTGMGNLYRVYYTYYMECMPGAYIQPQNVTVFFKPANGNYFSRLIHLKDSITYTNDCSFPGGTTSGCISTTSYPVFQGAIYSDTVTLAPSTWKIYTAVNNRENAIANLQNAGTYSLYVEAYLNNATQVNSSAKIMSPAAVIMGDTSNTLQTIAVPSSDLENDSLVYEWYQPQEWSGTGNPTPTAIPYGISTSGFSATNPLGSTGYVGFNLSNQTMQFKSSNLGKFSLAFRVKDYRNGVLMGYTSRDFEVIRIVIPKISNPLAAPNSVLSYTTCPGNTNTISLSFVDSVATDSVYLTVTPPTISGFTFNVNNTNGLGSATTNISWTTPANFNPATMPNFYINIQAKNTHCPAIGYSFYAVKVNTSQCVTVSVWSGDANGDWSVNVYDPLAVGVAYAHTGWLRPGATTNWQAEYCNNWVDTFANGVNMKHADCNGDGIVDTLDLPAITANYGMWHLKQTPKTKTTNVPDLYFDISGIAFTPGATVNIPIKLGSATNPMNNVYGIAGKINLGGINPSTMPQFIYTGGWLGNASNTISFQKNISTVATDWAYCRKDHLNASGQGTIAWLKLTIPVDAGGQTLNLSFGNIKLVDNKLQNITAFNSNDTSVYIQPVGIENINNNIVNASVVPNPSSNEAVLQFTTIDCKTVNLNVVDMTGKIVYTQQLQSIKGSNLIPLPQGISTGVYLLKLTTESQSVNLKWMRK